MTYFDDSAAILASYELQELLTMSIHCFSLRGLFYRTKLQPGESLNSCKGVSGASYMVEDRICAQRSLRVSQLSGLKKTWPNHYLREI